MSCEVAKLRAYCTSRGFLNQSSAPSPGPQWKQRCLPKEVSFSEMASELMRQADTYPFLILSLTLGPTFLALDLVVLRALLKRIARGYYAFIHQATVVCFYMFFTVVCFFHVIMTPLDFTNSYNCTNYVILQLYMISDALVWGSMYSCQFILLGTSLVRLSVFLRRTQEFGLRLSSEAMLGLAINLVGYGFGLGLGFGGEWPSGVHLSRPWPQYPASLAQVACYTFTDDYHTSDLANFHLRYGFCVRAIGDKVSEWVVNGCYGAASLVALAIALFLTLRFRTKMRSMVQMENFGQETKKRLGEERIVIVVLCAEAVIALAQASASIVGNLCWHGHFRNPPLQLDCNVSEGWGRSV